MSVLKKLHLAGVIGLVTTVVGVVADPQVMALLPKKTALAVALAGAVIQAVTRAVHKGDVEEVKKSTSDSE